MGASATIGGDTFRFNALKDGSGAGDVITDFVSGEDSVGFLRAAIVTDGDFAAHYFVSAAGAATAGNPSGVTATETGRGQFLFNQTTDQLWWD